MFFLRLLGKLLLFAALLAMAYDGVRILANPGRGFLFTSLSTHLSSLPDLRANLEGFFLANAPSYLWTGIVEPLLALPVSLLLAAAGTLIFLAGWRSATLAPSE